MMIVIIALSVLASAQVRVVPPPPAPKVESKSLEKSPYFAFVDRDFIFTVEVVSDGVPLFNFISMSDDEQSLPAKQVFLRFDTRTVPGKFFLIDTGNPQEPVVVPSLKVRPRSSFGVRLRGEYGEERELHGAVIQMGSDEFRLVPLTSFGFENLVLKVNRLNLGSPNFRDDWRVLKLETMGSRNRLRRR